VLTVPAACLLDHILVRNPHGHSKKLRCDQKREGDDENGGEGKDVRYCETGIMGIKTRGLERYVDR
jgi:hypothetical protein